ncbi:hypothetical protein MPL1032_180065 [Mesorhizobium plurifarium]|uniref:Uncharacterized protein n=1 Tax=Mesorhizobium plurifarium TaxID=69974 RepID=A0A0K2VU63_MESPL|nr:hypothetical protein MPL1032_180065 [Mesorhizobium plurifarium]
MPRARVLEELSRSRCRGSAGSLCVTQAVLLGDDLFQTLFSPVESIYRLWALFVAHDVSAHDFLG